jgi:quinol monooxygenase YgiN
MNEKTIVVTVLLLKPGFEELIVPELAPIIEAIRQIEGWLVFDLFRLSQERSTLVLHEVWETRAALEAYSRSPLKIEMTSLVMRFLAQPLRSWTVEEVY